MLLVIKRRNGEFEPNAACLPILRKPSVGSGRVGRAAVLRGFGPVGHAVVAHNARYTEAVIGKHARAPARLCLAVARKLTPAGAPLLRRAKTTATGSCSPS